jgi:MTH538 TIR-like domain (DUF1863)
MARRVFYSFHYEEDRDRVSQVRNMGVVEGSPIASDNDWEQILRGGKKVIKAWIDGQMTGTSCCVVLIGRATANREWVNYEIVESWNQGKGVVGVYIHRLKDLQGRQSVKGANPFDYVTFTQDGHALSKVARTYDPPFMDSKLVYGHIKENLEVIPKLVDK